MLDLKDVVTINNKKYLLSTIDVSVQLNAYPIMGALEYPFETALFRINDNNEVDWVVSYCCKYKTIEEAEKGHKDFLKRVQNGKNAIFGKNLDSLKCRKVRLKKASKSKKFSKGERHE